MTAFVALDKDAKKPVEGEMVKRPCPVPVATREFNNGLMNRDHFQSASGYRCLSSACSSAPRYKASYASIASDSMPVTLSTCRQSLPQARVSARKTYQHSLSPTSDERISIHKA